MWRTDWWGTDFHSYQPAAGETEKKIEKMSERWKKRENVDRKKDSCSCSPSKENTI
jgi:hypothetical protein